MGGPDRGRLEFGRGDHVRTDSAAARVVHRSAARRLCKHLRHRYRSGAPSSKTDSTRPDVGLATDLSTSFVEPVAISRVLSTGHPRPRFAAERVARAGAVAGRGDRSRAPAAFSDAGGIQDRRGENRATPCALEPSRFHPAAERSADGPFREFSRHLERTWFRTTAEVEDPIRSDDGRNVGCSNPSGVADRGPSSRGPSSRGPSKSRNSASGRPRVADRGSQTVVVDDKTPEGTDDH
jgi:hypothetical protein